MKAHGLPASELLQNAVRAELRRQELLSETDRYVADLVAEVGPPEDSHRAHASALARRIASMGITYRPATSEDALCLGVLGTQVFLDNYARQGIRPAMAREVLELFSVEAISGLLSSSSTAFLVAEQDHHLLAFAQLTLGSAHELVPFEPAIELKRLYVQEPFTGKGVGRDLLRHAEAFAASRDARALWLTAWVGNPRALAFYERQGYQELGVSSYIYENDEYETRVFLRELT